MWQRAKWLQIPHVDQGHFGLRVSLACVIHIRLTSRRGSQLPDVLGISPLSQSAGLFSEPPNSPANSHFLPLLLLFPLSGKPLFLFSLISSPPEASFTAHPQYPLVLYSVLVLSLHLGVNSEILWKEPFDWESKVNFELHICFMLGSHIWPCFLLSKVMMTSCTWMMWQDCFKDRYDNVGKELWKWFKDIRIPDIIIMGFFGCCAVSRAVWPNAKNFI